MTAPTRERPILFSGPMVRAILAGRKTQTRRVVGPTARAAINCRRGDRLWVRETWARVDYVDGVVSHHAVDSDGVERRLVYRADCPDLEWDDQPESRWRPSIHMPRWASRLTLAVTDVRVERLRDISEEDAKAEGVEPAPLAGAAIISDTPASASVSHRHAFGLLWDSINAARGHGWGSNPWVWVVAFGAVR